MMRHNIKFNLNNIDRFGLFSCLCGLMLLLAISMPVPSIAQEFHIVSGVADGETDRIIFYIDEETEYQLDVADDQLSINFTSNNGFDFGELLISPLPHVSEPNYTIEGEASVVNFTLADGVAVNHFRQGARLIVEVSLPVIDEEPEEVEETAAPVVSEAEVEVEVEVAEAQIDEQEETVVAEEDTVTTAPVDDVDLTQIELNNLSVTLDDETELVTQEEQAQQPVTEQPVTEQPLIVQTTQIRQSNLNPGEMLNISMTGNGNEQVIDFAWRFPVGAAVFKRAGYLWVIFDEESNADLLAVQPYINDRLLSAEQAHDYDQTLFRFKLNEGQDVYSERAANSWLVHISDNQTVPARPISLARQENFGDNFRIFVPLDNPGTHLRILDPLVGDIIDVIPVFDSGMGSAHDRSFAQFQILTSAQGLVMKRISDQVVVSRFSNGVAIGGITNLAISLSPLATDLATGSRENDLNIRPARLIDFEFWRLGGLDDFIKNRAVLYSELTESHPDNANDKRWNVARFYLGHDMPTEALAVLDLMAEADPEIAVDPKYRSVRGVTLYYLEDYDEAWRQLSARELDAEADVFLWRSIVAQKLGMDTETLALFERGRETLQFYENDKINSFRISVVEAALNKESFDTANWQLSLLRRTPMTPFQKADVDYLEGRLLDMMGEHVEAMNYFERVNEFVNRRAAAYSRYAQTLSRFERGEITSNQAILEMDALRFSWRGDKFEQTLLHGLGRLYLDKQDYRMGLITLRQAVSSFEDNIETRIITAEMTDAYRELFLNGAAESLPAVQALALYYDFRELTPLGAEGDLMIRKLADRLVSVDLLGRAAEILDHQVRFRLTGAAQSIIANRLAKIYLLDHKPEEARAIIRMTRQNTFPQDVLDERNLVEARILTELGEFTEAEVLIDGLEGDEVQTLRADIYWGSQNWEQVVGVIDGILNDRWQSPEPLTDDERQYLIRKVISLSLLGRDDDLKLIKQQYSALMKDGLLANAFDVITSPENTTSEELRDVVRRTASVSSLKSFMNSYRNEFIQGRNDDSG